MDFRRACRAQVTSIVIIALMLAISSVSIGSSRGEAEQGLRQVRSFEGGNAYRTGDDIYWVLELGGSWLQMGRQYGGLVKEELRRFHDEITEDLTARGMGYDAQLANAKELDAAFGAHIGDLVKGISETSGLSEEEVRVLNAGMCNLSMMAMQVEMPGSCSGIAAWGPYTPDGSLVFGRNWDIDRKSMAGYMEYLSVVAFNPEEGNSFANVHPLGNLYLETGINDKGAFIELNNGMASDPGYVIGLEDTVSVLVSALNECGTVEEAVDYLVSRPADMSYIIQVADEDVCMSVERATFGSRIRACEQEGVIAAYNNFIPPYPEEWAGKVADPPAREEDPRYENLIGLANSDRFFGKLDVEGMKELMGIGVGEGGAVHAGTVLQVVASLGQMSLWIRGLDHSDWQEVRLEGLFGRQ